MFNVHLIFVVPSGFIKTVLKKISSCSSEDDVKIQRSVILIFSSTLLSFVTVLDSFFFTARVICRPLGVVKSK